MLISAVLLAPKTVKNVMTSIEKCFLISDQRSLESALINEIVKYGHTRISVYRGDDRNEVPINWLHDL